MCPKTSKFQTISVNLCTRIPFERTDRVVNIDLYYTSLLIKFESLIVFRSKKCQAIKDQLYQSCVQIGGCLYEFPVHCRWRMVRS